MGNIIEMIKGLPVQIWIVAGVILLYFLMNLFFPKSKNKSKEEIKQDEIEQSRKHKTNYSVKSSSYYREATADVYRPSDGTSSMTRSSAGYRKIDKHNHTQETIARQKQYEKIFAAKERNLNHIGRFMEITNDEVVKDLKYFQKKKRLFTNVLIDYKNCKVSYGDDFEDEEQVDRELAESNFDDEIEETVENEEYFDEENQLKRKCPKCGTLNVIDINDKEYRCFCCLSMNPIE